MDLVRLALERCRSAAAAVELIGGLVKRYGQFGSGVPTKDHAEGGYDNAFLVPIPPRPGCLKPRPAMGCPAPATGLHIDLQSGEYPYGLGCPEPALVEYAEHNAWWPETPAPF